MEQDTREQVVEHVKERIYVTFTALSVVTAMRSHGEVTALEAMTTLAITVGATLLAVSLAEVVAHVQVYQRLQNKQHLRQMGAAIGGGLAAVALPFVFLMLAVAEVWDVAGALSAAQVLLLVSLIVIGVRAVRRAQIPKWQRWFLLSGEFLLGVAVITLEGLAH